MVVVDLEQRAGLALPRLDALPVLADLGVRGLAGDVLAEQVDQVGYALLDLPQALLVLLLLCGLLFGLLRGLGLDELVELPVDPR